MVEADDRAAARRRDLDEALGVQLVQRRAHRPAADAEVARDRRLDERRAGRHAARDDRLAQRVHDAQRVRAARELSVRGQALEADPLTHGRSPPASAQLPRSQACSRCLKTRRVYRAESQPSSGDRSADCGLTPSHGSCLGSRPDACRPPFRSVPPRWPRGARDRAQAAESAVRRAWRWPAPAPPSRRSRPTRRRSPRRSPRSRPRAAAPSAWQATCGARRTSAGSSTRPRRSSGRSTCSSTRPSPRATIARTRCRSTTGSSTSRSTSPATSSAPARRPRRMIAREQRRLHRQHQLDRRPERPGQAQFRLQRVQGRGQPDDPRDGRSSGPSSASG